MLGASRSGRQGDCDLEFRRGELSSRVKPEQFLDQAIKRQIDSPSKLLEEAPDQVLGGRGPLGNGEIMVWRAA